uniref:Uncharacterized protein n=1 Tax=Cacopsylla melanoneura TaxID=428564 RepID=A0A8D8Y5B2_9HEMI
MHSLGKFVLKFSYMLECIGSPVSGSIPTCGVYTHVPPILSVCSYTTILNLAFTLGSVNLHAQHRPDAPAPMMATLWTDGSVSLSTSSPTEISMPEFFPMLTPPGSPKLPHFPAQLGSSILSENTAAKNDQ